MPTLKMENNKPDVVEITPEVITENAVAVQSIDLADALDNVGLTNEVIAQAIKEGFNATTSKGYKDFKTMAKYIEFAIEIKKPKRGQERGKLNFFVNIKEKPKKEGFENFIGR